LRKIPYISFPVLYQRSCCYWLNIIRNTWVLYL